MRPDDTTTRSRSERTDDVQRSTARRGKTGDVCRQSGCYRFDGYEDADPVHAPALPDLEVYVKEGEMFPPVRSTWKSCWWALVEGGPSCSQGAGEPASQPSSRADQEGTSDIEYGDVGAPRDRRPDLPRGGIE
jgi:hypothetical protein